MRTNLKAPFPYFGGKRRAAEIVWSRLGPVSNYIEPFAGSIAMLLCRPPDGPRIETINDVDCYVANFWRATSIDPEAVAFHADGPVNEADLHARHRWLVLSAASMEFRERMRRDPEYFDVRVAGWWCWGLCCWIGSGWCSMESEVDRKGVSTPALAGSGGEGQGVVRSTWNQRPDIAGFNGDGLGAKGVHSMRQKKPLTTGAGRSASVRQQVPDSDRDGGSVAHKKRPRLAARDASGTGVHSPAGDVPLHGDKKPLLNAGGNAVETPGRGIHGVNGSNRPQLGNDHAGTCDARYAWLVDWFGQLRDRLRTVRVCCGHWKRVCDSPSVTTRLGVTGVFLDPPYPTHSIDGVKSRDGNLYASDQDGRDALDELRDDVLAYCLERGDDKKMRIAVCGYDTDGYARLEAEGWTVVPWKAQGGYGNRGGSANENAARERIWFSPHCVDPTRTTMPLFSNQD